MSTSGRIDRAFLGRLLAISLTSSLSSPLRLWERVAYGRLVGRTTIHPSPIFIIGHWRSGTTHLQNLMCQDKALGHLSAFQAIAPGFCLVGRGAIRRLLARAVEAQNPTRPMDNVSFSLDAPQEEELALANMTPHCFYHSFAFPRQAQAFFRRYVLFEDLPEGVLTRWIEAYLTLLRKITLASGGKRLILKNCANAARIPILLDLFPEAKFIHILRNPYDVFVSTMHLHERLTSICQLQSISLKRIEMNVLSFYRQLMLKFLEDRALIPSGSLVEVRYEDLEKAPLGELRRIYATLGLPGLATAEPAFRSYIASIADYRKNEYRLGTDAVTEVNEEWRFAFDEWGYDLL